MTTQHPPIGTTQPKRPTPYYVAIGVLAVVLAGLLIWAFVPRDKTPRPEGPVETSTHPSPVQSASERPASEPIESTPADEVSPTAFEPSEPTSAEDKIADGYEMLRAILPKQLEGWELQEATGVKNEAMKQPVYKDGKRRISFVPMGSSGHTAGRGTDTEQVFEGGVCDVNTANAEMISCNIAPKAAEGHSFVMSSRYSDMDEMVRLSKAIIAAPKQ